MLFMKEQRAAVAAECTLKESAAINQILGRRWHALDRAEQSKYYEMARKEKELHMQLYPGWSARDNYAAHAKKKKRKREPSDKIECTTAKKCRARFGLDQQGQWCKPCRRKKKCIRFMTGEGDTDSEQGDDDDCEGNDSIATVDSTTDVDGDSARGSPMPTSSGAGDDFSVQHPLVSQSQPSGESFSHHKPSLPESSQSQDECMTMNERNCVVSSLAANTTAVTATATPNPVSTTTSTAAAVLAT